jgi:uncharacterized membrane protein
LLRYIQSIVVGVVAVVVTVAFFTAVLHAWPFYGSGIHFDLRNLMGMFPWTTRLMMLVLFALAFRWQFRRGRT